MRHLYLYLSLSIYIYIYVCLHIMGVSVLSVSGFRYYYNNRIIHNISSPKLFLYLIHLKWGNTRKLWRVKKKFSNGFKSQIIIWIGVTYFCNIISRGWYIFWKSEAYYIYPLYKDEWKFKYCCYWFYVIVIYFLDIILLILWHSDLCFSVLSYIRFEFFLLCMSGVFHHGWK